MTHKLLYVCPLAKVHQKSRVRAAPPDFEVIIEREPDRDLLLILASQVEFIVTERAGAIEIDREVLAAGEHLRLVQRIGSLAYDIDLEAARDLGVPVAYWPMDGCIAVAEHLMMQILVLLKRARAMHAVATSREPWNEGSRRTDEDTFSYNWSKQRDITGLLQMKVGVLGFGEIGSELARRLVGFRPAAILYNKRNPLASPVEEELGITFASVEDLLTESDIVVNLLPYSPSTDHFINEARLAAMKRDAILVHAGSGSVIDELALANALRSGWLSGAALDTYEWEPIRPDNPLLDLPADVNLLLTPHTAAAHPVVHTGEQRGYYDNPLRLLRGEELIHRIV